MTNHETIPESLTFEDFEPLIDQDFELTFNGEPFIFKLTEAKLSRHAAPDPSARAAFSLIFLCADTRILPQMIYTMRNEHLGHREIFCVPVAAGADGVRYEAVFN
jgi:hypothetical protein